MKRSLIFTFLVLSISSFAVTKDTLIYYSLPDSVKAVSFLADISVSTVTTKKESYAGIRTDVVKLSMESHKKTKEIVFEFPSGSPIMASGLAVKKEKDELSWRYNWNENENYKLLIATAGDSAGNFALYSGYIFLPKEKKWKLIGTCKIQGQWNTLKQPAIFYSMIKNTPTHVSVNDAWCQRNNGSWKNMLERISTSPIVNLLSHIDSVVQLQIDMENIKAAIGKTGVKENKDGIYYTIIKEGAGRQVSVNDTVTVFYKGYLMSDNSVFDETKEKPAIFPLKRLIAGWQIGVPLCKVGGKIRFVVPSSLAYSIRTRAAKIPPNSILVFEVEIMDAKSPQ